MCWILTMSQMSSMSIRQTWKQRSNLLSQCVGCWPVPNGSNACTYQVEYGDGCQFNWTMCLMLTMSSMAPLSFGSYAETDFKLTESMCCMFTTSPMAPLSISSLSLLAHGEYRRTRHNISSTLFSLQTDTTSLQSTTVVWNRCTYHSPIYVKER